MKCEELLKELKKHIETIRDSADIIKEEGLKLSRSRLIRALGFDDEYVLRSDPLKISRRIINFLSMLKFEPKLFELCIEDVCFNYVRFFGALDSYVEAQKKLRRDIKFVDICKL
jgi:hypothetical protein